MNEQEKHQFLALWSATRQKGAWRYVLATALSWGTVSAFLVRLLITLLDQGLHWPAIRAAFWSEEYLRYWGVFLLGGLCYAVTMWFYFGWQYRRLRRQEKQGEDIEGG